MKTDVHGPTDEQFERALAYNQEWQAADMKELGEGPMHDALLARVSDLRRTKPSKHAMPTLVRDRPLRTLPAETQVTAEMTDQCTEPVHKQKKYSPKTRHPKPYRPKFNRS